MHVLVAPSKAETTRRALDAEGLLDVTLRAFKHNGCVALPLSQAAQTALEARADAEGDPDQKNALLRWSGGVLHAERLAAADLSNREGRGPRAAMHAACAQALSGCPAELSAVVLGAEALPRRWEKLGDIALFAPSGIFEEGSAYANAFVQLPQPSRLALLAALSASIGAERLGVQSRVETSLHRKSTARIIWPSEGASGWTVHRENGISYGLDVTRSMFSSGNGTEKARVAGFPCADQIVVDLYAGIGYFTLGYLVHAGVKHLHACEWDDDALDALRHNLEANSVAERCTVYPGDNAGSLEAFRGTAHRVNLGLIPSSEAGWPIAVSALRPNGGMMHVHANLSSDAKQEAEWVDALLARIRELSRAQGYQWEVRLQHLEYVKWYAPRIRHVVADVQCVQMTVAVS